MLIAQPVDEIKGISNITTGPELLKSVVSIKSLRIHLYGLKNHAGASCRVGTDIMDWGLTSWTHVSDSHFKKITWSLHYHCGSCTLTPG